MASLQQREGRFRLQFTWGKERVSIPLGTNKRIAETVKIRVETMLSAKLAGVAFDPDTARWLNDLDSTIFDKLVGAGIVVAREKAVKATLQAFLDGYIDSRKVDAKPATLIVWGHTRRNLIDHFGADKPLADITPGDADGFRLFLIGSEKLADATVRKRCGFAKQFFAAAVRRRLITENPFSDLVSTIKKNTKRFYFVSRDEAQKVIDSCPDAQWRLLFALSRFGGLRCPSEHLRLKWEDVDWANGRMTVTSPKTEHHEGKESRQVPLFPELLPHLQEAWELAPPGTQYVISRYRDTNANLRTRLLKIIKRAGLKPWPKLFQNLRSTRETELAEKYPMHVVCAWIGNTEAVATKHYLQVTDAHFQQAASGASNVQQAPELHRNAPQGVPTNAKNAVNTAFSQVKVEDRGLEPLTFWLPARRSPN
jgi:integrase